MKYLPYVLLGVGGFFLINSLTKNKVSEAIGSSIVSGTTGIVSGATQQIYDSAYNYSKEVAQKDLDAGFDLWDTFKVPLSIVNPLLLTDVFKWGG
jgi:hypothetical protein